MRRAVAAMVVTGLAGVAGLVAPAVASADSSTTGVAFTSPPSSGAVLSSSPLILTGTVSQPGGFVDDITITVNWADTVKRPPGSHPPQWVSYTPDVRQATVPWNYGPDLAFNGHYTVTVTAQTDTGPGTPLESVTATSPFVSNQSPVAPSGITATTDAGKRITTLSWTANPEPDLIGYEVIRAGPSPSDPGKAIAAVYAPAASYTDDGVATQPAGSYRYEVIAVRQDGAGDGVLLSSPSPAADAAFATPPKAAAPTPTTTAPTGTSGATGTASSIPARGTTATSAGPHNPIVLPRASNALPDYQALLNQARATTVTVPPPDPGFVNRLPYQPQTNSHQITLPAIEGPALLGSPDSSGNGLHQSVEFVAAALLLAVLAMFGLVLKRSAEQSAVLEALAPETFVAAASRLGSARRRAREESMDTWLGAGGVRAGDGAAVGDLFGEGLDDGFDVGGELIVMGGESALAADARGAAPPAVVAAAPEPPAAPEETAEPEVTVDPIEAWDDLVAGLGNGPFDDRTQPAALGPDGAEAPVETIDPAGAPMTDLALAVTPMTDLALAVTPMTDLALAVTPLPGTGGGRRGRWSAWLSDRVSRVRAGLVAEYSRTPAPDRPQTVPGAVSNPTHPAGALAAPAVSEAIDQSAESQPAAERASEPVWEIRDVDWVVLPGYDRYEPLLSPLLFTMSAQRPADGDLVLLEAALPA